MRQLQQAWLPQAHQWGGAAPHSWQPLHVHHLLLQVLHIQYSRVRCLVVCLLHERHAACPTLYPSCRGTTHLHHEAVEGGAKDAVVVVAVDEDRVRHGLLCAHAIHHTLQDEGKGQRFFKKSVEQALGGWQQVCGVNRSV